MRTFAITGLLLAAVAAAGCQMPVKEVTLMKKPVQYQQLRDIPVPTGFAFKSGDSFIYDGNFRHAELTYIRQSFRQVEPVVTFYKDQMAKAGWNLTWQYGTPDEPKLVFTKEFDQCEVEVRTKQLVGEQDPITLTRITLSPAST